MAYNVQGTLNAVAATMATAWADVLPPSGGGIFYVNQVMRQSFEQVTIEAEGGDFPVGVIWLRPGTSGEWGIVNAAMEADLSLYRVEQESLDDQSVWDKLETLKSALFAASYTGMTVIEQAQNNVDPTNDALAFFLNRDVPYTAGSITMRIVYGESAL